MSIHCSVSDCRTEISRKAKSGMCRRHAVLTAKFGQPEPPTAEQRLMERVRGFEADECWPFNRSSRHAYISVDGASVGAHRVSYVMHHGPIPEGMVVRHRCDNPPCVNPAHLEIGTQADNVRDMYERGRNNNFKPTHCRHGHEFTEENTRHWRGERICRTCARERERRYRMEAAS